MLCRNFARAWPRRDAAMPAWEAAVYQRLGERLLGDRWDPMTGLGRNLDRRLREHIARVPQRLEDDPDVRFFTERNPGYAQGDVLLCLAPLDARNWWSVARRIFRRRRS